MKKRRAILGVLLPILALTLSACDFLPTDLFGGKDNSQPSSSRRIRSNNSSSRSGAYPSGHVHKFSEEWSSNSQYHWHDATCGHDVRSEVAPHNLQTEVIKAATCQETGQKIDYCTICGYEANVVIPTTNHTWSEYDRKEPTCLESGYIKKFCTVCGVFGEDYLPPTEHNFEEEIIQYRTCVDSEIIRRRCKVCGYEEIIDNGCYGHDFQVIEHQDSTCSQQGYDRLYCSRCGEVIYSYYQLANHVWSGNVSSVAPASGVPYLTDYCLNCGQQKIAVATVNGSIEGGIKDSIATQYGYIKLGSNGAALNLEFTYPESAYVRIYQHAIYDNWRNDSYRYANYHCVSSALSPDPYNYNFSMEVNGQLVDMSESGYISYFDFFANSTEINQDLIDNGFSPAADCLIGDAQLVPGINTIQYKRLGSYCLNVDYFVFVITNTNHQHNLSSGMNYDEQYHWRQCMDPNCPISGGIVDKYAHNYYQYRVDRGESCSDIACVINNCADCGYYQYSYERLEHNYNENETTYVTNSNSYQQSINHCSTCSKTVQAYQFSCGTVVEGSYSSGRLTQGTTMKWRFPVSKTGYVSLYLPMYVSSASYLSRTFESSLYDISFNGNSCQREDIYCTYQDAGVRLYETKYIKFATYYVTEYDVATSEVEVTLTSSVSSYRPFFDGEIRLEY